MITRVERALAALQSAAPPEPPSTLVQRVSDAVVQAVAELPDRTSPDDWLEGMLVTADELRAIVADALLRAERDEQQRECPWCGESVAVLKPAGGCLTAEVRGRMWHPQCANEYEDARDLLRAEPAAPEAGWQREVKSVAGEIGDVMSHYTKRQMVPLTADDRTMLARLEMWRKCLLDTLPPPVGQDDPAGCPAGHGDQCCRDHAACRKALAESRP